MFPWSLDHVAKTVIGRPLMPIAEELFSKKFGQTPNRATLRKLGRGEFNFRPSLIRAFDLEVPLEVTSKLSFEDIAPSFRCYREFIQQTFKAIEELERRFEAQATIEALERPILAFPHTVRAILWVEQCKRPTGHPLSGEPDWW